MGSGVNGHSGSSAVPRVAQETSPDLENALTRHQPMAVITAVESLFRHSSVRGSLLVLLTVSGTSGPTGQSAPCPVLEV